MIASLLLFLSLTPKPLVCVPDTIPSEDSKCTMLAEAPPIPKHREWESCTLMMSGTVGEPETDKHFYECYWDSIHWYPQGWNVVKDFMSRSGNLKEEHIVDHWGVSFELEEVIAGDCGMGVYRVTYHNIAKIESQPEFIHQVLTMYAGDCRNSFGITLGDK